MKLKDTKKPQLKILVGVSGSGKSSWATEFIKKNKNWVRVNRDDIRRNILGKLTPDYYSSDKFNSTEKHINTIQDEQIRYWLHQGQNVIVDNTHLQMKYINHYKKEFGHLAEVNLSIFNADPEECKKRVLQREGADISVNYIDKQHQAFINTIELLKKEESKAMNETLYYYDKPNRLRPKCIIVDIDGTVADCSRVRDVHNGNDLHLDEVIKPVKTLLKRFKGNWLQRIFDPVTIIYLSGREDKWKDKTVKWLKDNKLPFDDHIYMRKTGDFRKDSIVKEELYVNHVHHLYNTQFVIDDRISVCHTWNRIGLFVICVNQGLKHF